MKKILLCILGIILGVFQGYALISGGEDPLYLGIIVMVFLALSLGALLPNYKGIHEFYKAGAKRSWKQEWMEGPIGGLLYALCGIVIISVTSPYVIIKVFVNARKEIRDKRIEKARNDLS